MATQPLPPARRNGRLSFFAPGQVLYLVEHQGAQGFNDVMEATRYLDAHPAVRDAFGRLDPDLRGWIQSARRHDLRVVRLAGQQAGLPAAVTYILETIDTSDNFGERELVEYVQKLNSAINRHIGLPRSRKVVATPQERRRDAPFDQNGALLQGVTFNWYFAPASDQRIVGGPGGLPVMSQGVNPYEFTISYRTNSFGQGGAPDEEAEGDGVTVYVLDTVLSDERLERLNLLSESHPVAQLLVGAPTGLVPVDMDCNVDTFRLGDEPGLHLLISRLRDDDWKGSRSGVASRVLDDHDYNMEDHGVFIAGIVRAIARGARIHLIETLDSQGVGTLSSMVDAFDALICLHRDGMAVVNCSFTITVPNDMPSASGHSAITAIQAQIADLDTDIAGAADLEVGAEHRDRARQGWQEMRDRLAARLDSLRDMIHLLKINRGIAETAYLATQYLPRALDPQRFWVVAAAGNDGHARHEPPAKYPAADDTVTGVGSANSDMNLHPSLRRAHYSNEADNPESQGVSTLGGGANRRGNAWVTTGDGNADPGVPGIYTGGDIWQPSASGKSDRGVNTFQWARWAGTSFATPIIAGAMARLRSSGRSFNEAQISLGIDQGVTDPPPLEVTLPT